MTYWTPTDNGETITYTFAHGGNLTITQRKGVCGRDAVSIEGASPSVPKEAWDELVEDIKRYDQQGG
jgi:beta-galactosidase GanA